MQVRTGIHLSKEKVNMSMRRLDANGSRDL